MDFTDEANQPTEDSLSRDQIVALQTELVRVLGARIGIDGQLGPLTVAAARDALERGVDRVDPAILDLARLAALNTEPGDPYTWAFFSDEQFESDAVKASLDGDVGIFWKIGAPAGRGRIGALGTCDTVLILSRSRIRAIGVFVAGNSLHFVDTESRERHPVRIWRYLDAPYPITLAGVDLGTEADDYSAEGIARVGNEALDQFRTVLDKFDIPLPIPAEIAYHFASEHRLETYLERAPDILPDLDTARALGWTGKVWSGPATASFGSVGDEQRPAMSATAPDSGAESKGSERDAHFPFVLDASMGSEDDLDRGPFALFLAQRLHLIWCQLNGCAPGPDGKRTVASSPDADTFIAHVDSPWGGGKTTFANFVARVLDPRREILTQRHFLRSSIAPTETDPQLARHPLDKIFVPDFARTDEAKWPEAHRPWIIARYNAWRDQYVTPPWWHVFQTIETAIAGEVWREARVALRPGAGKARRFGRAGGAFCRWLGIKALAWGYRLGNSRVKGQVLLSLMMVALLCILWAAGIVQHAIDAATVRATATAKGGLDPKDLAAWISLAVAVLGFAGASVATMFSVVTQSLSPDLDFSAEHTQIGVRDPISRFRKAFHRILMLSRRPVMLIVDDLDRCEPGTVVEILRGFQTIVRSPRLFVLLLGDRAWIETAHDVCHKDMVAMCGGEGTLGSLFVQKVIQLSFRLPTIKDDARGRYARKVLGDVEPQSRTADAVRAAIEDADRGLDDAVRSGGSLADREQKVEAAKREAAGRLAGLGDAERRAAATVIDQLANVKMVAAAGADTRQQQSVAQAVERLIRSLPNNPRQIKRIFMAFSTYEAVGRAYFGYSLTAQGKDGSRKARRWRQLAVWVTLATEWPDSWRAIARSPLLADAAFGDGSERAEAEKLLLAGHSKDLADSTKAIVRRLRGDAELRSLLGRDPDATDDFGQTRLESDAVYEFNRIIWEPGFPLRARD